MMSVINPKHSECFGSDVWVTDTSGFDDGSNMVTLKKNHNEEK